jgi:hypothetical protein
MDYDATLLRNALIVCTGYDLQLTFDDTDDANVYALVDPYGEQDGDTFETLEDVFNYITNNDEVFNYIHAANFAYQ